MRDHFHFYADAGHGWLAVTTDDLADLGLRASDFSACSYKKRDLLYLEEDCDAGLFILAYQAKTGRRPAIEEHVTDGESLIRTFPRLPDSGRTMDDWRAMFRKYEAMIAAAA